MKALCVVGARPNFIKVKPIIDALAARGAESVLVHTGQHYDAALSDVFFADLGMAQPAHHLGVGSGTQAEQVGRVMIAFEPLLADVAPDVVVVVGDVNSTMACSLVTAKAAPLLAHVEAGLRSRDWQMPEEVNRVVTDRVADLLLAPSDDAVENLVAEGFAKNQIHLVGNVMVDSLLANLERALERPVLAELGLRPRQYGVVTLHRPANVDDPEILEPLLRALATIGAECPLVLPAHPRAGALLRAHDSPALRVIPPLGYLDFIALEAQAAIALTDSGGVQEETTILGVPCLTLRDNTERPITVSQGTNVVVGRDPRRVIAEAMRVLRDGVPARRPVLWDGKAATRVAAVLSDAVNDGPSASA
jgi:UDP-N-acetylglucosamine 2-epimerase (non-hydrolysing)